MNMNTDEPTPERWKAIKAVTEKVVELLRKGDEKGARALLSQEVNNGTITFDEAMLGDYRTDKSQFYERNPTFFTKWSVLHNSPNPEKEYFY